MKKSSEIHEYVYFNEEIMLYNDATIGLAANSLQYGGTVFGGIRGYAKNGNYYVFRLEAHYKRLMKSAKIMYFNFEITYEKFSEIIQQLLHKNQPQGEFYIRPFIFSDVTKLGPRFHHLDFQLAIYTQDIAKLEPGTPIKAIISSVLKYPDNSISSKAKVGGAYVNSALAGQEAFNYGVDDALMFDVNGYLVEATVANVIINYNGKLYTPNLGSSALNGITIQTVKEQLAKQKIELIETNIDRSMLLSSDEIIILGTASKFKNVIELNGLPIYNPDNNNILNAALHKIFKELEQNDYYTKL